MCRETQDNAGHSHGSKGIPCRRDANKNEQACVFSDTSLTSEQTAVIEELHACATRARQLHPDAQVLTYTVGESSDVNSHSAVDLGRVNGSPSLSPSPTHVLAIKSKVLRQNSKS